MTKHCLCMALCVVLCGQMSSAQSVGRTVSIDELFTLAEANNKKMHAYATDVEVADAQIEESKSNRLPDVNASLSLSYIGNGRVWDRDFKNGVTAEMPHFGNSLAVEVSQPIYTGGAITSGINLAKYGKEMALLNQEQNRQDVRYRLVDYYLALFKLTNREQVLRNNIRLTDDVIATTKARAEQGTVLKNDITRYELQLENQKLALQSVLDARSIVNYQLCNELGLSTDTKIEVDTTVINGEMKQVSEAEWQAMAAQTSLGVRKSTLAAQMSVEKEKIERAEKLPHVALVAADNLNGPILIEVPVIDKNFNYWFVGVGVKYNLSSLYKSNKKLRRAELQTRLANENVEVAREGIENAVQANYTNLLTAQADLRTQQKSVELANQNYQVTRNRYENDLALLTDMIDASNVKLNAELSLVDARINVMLKYYMMKYVSGVL